MAQAISQKLAHLSLDESSKPSSPPASPTPVQAEPEITELCTCPPSPNMVQLMNAGIRLPVHYYGFLIDEEPGGFIDFARRFVEPDHMHRWTIDDLFMLGLRKIHRLGKLRKEPAAKMAWVDNWAKAECPRVKKAVGRQVVVLPLFANNFSSYDGRPTQKQVDLMSRLLGQRPRWWQAAPM